MNVIFLDMDGVITSARYRGFREPDPVAVEFVNHILERWPAYLVISSSWRMAGFHFFDRYFKNLHMDWATPVLASRVRGEEIQEWLNEYKEEVENYLILDDDADMLEDQMNHFVQTDPENGLLYSHMTDIMGRTGVGVLPPGK